MKRFPDRLLSLPVLGWLFALLLVTLVTTPNAEAGCRGRGGSCCGGGGGGASCGGPARFLAHAVFHRHRHRQCGNAACECGPSCNCAPECNCEPQRRERPGRYRGASGPILPGVTYRCAEVNPAGYVTLIPDRPEAPTINAAADLGDFYRGDFYRAAEADPGGACAGGRCAPRNW